MPVSWLVRGHLEKLRKHKEDIHKWVNGVGESREKNCRHVQAYGMCSCGGVLQYAVRGVHCRVNQP